MRNVHPELLFPSAFFVIRGAKGDAAFKFNDVGVYGVPSFHILQ